MVSSWRHCVRSDRPGDRTSDLSRRGEAFNYYAKMTDNSVVYFLHLATHLMTISKSILTMGSDPIETLHNKNLVAQNIASLKCLHCKRSLPLGVMVHITESHKVKSLLSEERNERRSPSRSFSDWATQLRIPKKNPSGGELLAVEVNFYFRPRNSEHGQHKPQRGKKCGNSNKTIFIKTCL